MYFFMNVCIKVCIFLHQLVFYYVFFIENLYKMLYKTQKNVKIWEKTNISGQICKKTNHWLQKKMLKIFCKCIKQCEKSYDFV